MTKEMIDSSSVQGTESEWKTYRETTWRLSESSNVVAKTNIMIFSNLIIELSIFVITLSIEPPRDVSISIDKGATRINGLPPLFLN